MRFIAYFAVLLSVLQCSTQNTQEHKRKKFLAELLEIELIQLLQANPNANPYQDSACTSYSQPLNALYLQPQYYPTFHADQTQYTNILGIDSTMAISSTYTGFYNASITQNWAISGQTLCDALIELPSINTINPQVFIVSTNAGNDLLRTNPIITISQIQETQILFVQAIHKKFPNTKLVVTGIHPTRVAYANANRAQVNLNMQNALAAEYPSSYYCFYDPEPLFGVGPGQQANTGDMLPSDVVHYNQAMSFQIKNALQTNCGITF